MPEIRENGESREITQAQAEQFQAAGLIYFCEDVGCDCFHIAVDRGWEDISAAPLPADYADSAE